MATKTNGFIRKNSYLYVKSNKLIIERKAVKNRYKTKDLSSLIMGVTFQEEKIHEVKDFKRIRETMGLTQDALGQKCESKFDQRRKFEFETLLTILEPTLQELADALRVTVEFIRAFSEEKTTYNIQINNPFEVSDSSFGLSNQPNVTYNNSDKLESLLLDLTKVVAFCRGIDTVKEPLNPICI